MSKCDGHQCGCHPSSVNQTLNEMDFERGIWTAALDGDLPRVRSYLDKGGDPDACDVSGYSALHYASRNGKIKVCEELLNHGACSNIQTRSGNVTPLHRAAYCGHIDIISLLFEHKANPLLCDNDGQTALHKACERGHSDIIQFLLHKTPGIAHIRDKRERMPQDLLPLNQSHLINLFENITSLT